MYSIILLCSNVLTMQSISLLQMQIKEAALEDYPFKNHWAAFGFAGPVRYYLWIIGKCMHSFVGMWRGNQIFHFYMFSIIFNNILHVFNNPFVFWPCKVSHCCKRTATRQHLKTITHYFSFKNQRTIASLKASPGPITIGTLNCPPSDELVWWSIKRSDHGDQSPLICNLQTLPRKENKLSMMMMMRMTELMTMMLRWSILPH